MNQFEKFQYVGISEIDSFNRSRIERNFSFLLLLCIEMKNFNPSIYFQRNAINLWNWKITLRVGEFLNLFYNKNLASFGNELRNIFSGRR